MLDILENDCLQVGRALFMNEVAGFIVIEGGARGLSIAKDCGRNF